MSVFCSLDEAFAGPPSVPPAPPGKKKKQRTMLTEPFVPSVIPSVPDPDRPAEKPAPIPDPMNGGGGSSSSGIGPRLESGVSMQDFFPLPGETAEPEEWQKAFMLEGSQLPGPMASVEGKPTLWRQIASPVLAPAPASAPVSLPAPIPSEINRRLDALTRQLESLSVPTSAQNTAELFLFVAVGLLLLLAMDTLLRFAVAMASRTVGRAGRAVGVRPRFR